MFILPVVEKMLRCYMLPSSSPPRGKLFKNWLNRCPYDDQIIIVSLVRICLQELEVDQHIHFGVSLTTETTHLEFLRTCLSS